MEMQPEQTSGPVYTLDAASAARQMAALSSVGKARRAVHSQQDEASLSPSVPFANIGFGNYHQMSQAQAPQILQRQRHGFYHSLAGIWLQKNNPLPPAITGVDTPYDPNTSSWKSFEPGAQGSIKLNGRDIDLFRLWTAVISLGGIGKVSQANAWSAIAQQLDLPSEFPHPNQPTTSLPTGLILAHYYKIILIPYEEAYMRNAKQQAALQQAKAAASIPPGTPSSTAQPATPATPSHMTGPGVIPPLSQSSGNQPRLPLSIQPPPPGAFPPGGQPAHAAMSVDSPQRQAIPSGATATPTPEGAEDDTKTAEEPGTSELESRAGRSALDAPGSAQSVPTRRKIEYIPITREVESFGGRDVVGIEQELAKFSTQRTHHDVNEWGQVDIEGLAMSLRSRIPSEVAYSLGTMSVLSTMRGTNPNSGFPLPHAEDMLEEILDFLEETAFGVVDDDAKPDVDEGNAEQFTHRQLCDIAIEEASQSLYGLVDPASSRPNGPLPTRAEFILCVTNLLRNFSLTMENQAFMGKESRILEIVLRVASLQPNLGSRTPKPLVEGLKLRDLIQIRRDVLHIVLNIAGNVDLTGQSRLTIKRAFRLAISFLADPLEAISPSTYVMQFEAAGHMIPPPNTADLALEFFSKLAQPDLNRRAISEVVSEDEQWALLEALIHRMPLSDLDYKVMSMESWLPYAERMVFSIYCLAFIASPQLKKRMRGTRSLGILTVLTRMVKKYTMIAQNEFRHFFSIQCRRAIETLKLLDDGGNSFDTPQAVMPLVAFGMGYGEQGNTKVEVGSGILGGYQEDITWGVLKSGNLDSFMFSEMESLARVG